MNACIQKALTEFLKTIDWDAAETDWENDLQGQEAMSYGLFYDAIFEFVGELSSFRGRRERERA